MNIAARALPHNLDAEKSVLGSVFIKPAVFPEVASDLATDDFFLPAHREIFDADLAVHGRGPAEPGVREHQLGVLVTRDQPALTAVGQPDARDRFVPAQFREKRVDVDPGRFAERISAHLGI